MRTLFIFLLIAPIELIAQSNTDFTGIKWAKDLSWIQLKEKARKENKYIFLDCYATWCGPCKKMDEEVFNNRKVGEYINERFIPVKVQMDKTDKDTEHIRQWYADAENLNKLYKVLVFPTYLFFSPDGKIVHRATSYNKVDDFITIAETALNPNAQFYSLLEQYEKGRKDYSVFPYLISMAQKLADKKLEKELTDEYLSYLSTLPLKNLYTKERIEIIAATLNSTKSKFFKMFYRNRLKVNAVMGDGDYSWRTVNTIITKQMFGTLEISRNSSEPKWDSLYDVIKKRFGSRHADRVIFYRKMWWYENDRPLHVKYFIELIKRNAYDSTSLNDDTQINGISYLGVLFTSSDTSEINIAINAMEGVVRRSATINPMWDASTIAEYRAMVIDTYACLLYKVGRKQEAIESEKQALQLATEFQLKGDAKAFQDKLQRMEKGQTLKYL